MTIVEQGQDSGAPGACVTFLRTTDTDCKRCTLRASALFADLDTPELERLTRHVASGVVRRGTEIYRAGDVGQAVFTIRVGVVKLLLDAPDREGRIVRLLGRGATLGLEALAGRPYAHTAVAMRTTGLCRIPIPTVDELHAHNPRLIHGLMDKWNEQVEWADRWIAILGSGPVHRRLTDLVRLIADISGDPLESLHLFPVSDIAAILGVSAPSVSRHLAALKRAGLLTRVGPRTYRCDPALFQPATKGPRSTPNRGAPLGLGIAFAPWVPFLSAWPDLLERLAV